MGAWVRHTAVGVFLLLVIGTTVRSQAQDCIYGPAPELLALREIETLTPNPALTAEIRADLEAIYLVWPFFRTVCAHPNWVPSEVIIELDSATAEAYHAGEFHGFDELHAALGGLKYALSRPPDSPRVAFGFNGLYHPAILADLHRAVQGVVRAYPNAIGTFDCQPTDVERQEPHLYHFRKVEGSQCFEDEWCIRVQDGVPEFVHGDAIPVADGASSWGMLKARY
jgi:hypothetical protein